MDAQAPPSPLRSSDPLKSEDFLKLLTERPDGSQRVDAALLAPIDLSGLTIDSLTVDNQVVSRHVDFTGVTFTGDTSFKGTSFLAGVNFTKAVFHGLVEFDGSIFDGANSMQVFGAPIPAGSIYADLLPRLGFANFERAKFLCGATFIGAAFRVKSNFKYASFVGPAYFWRCRFSGAAFFTHLEVEPTPAGRIRHAKHEHRHPGEANFAYCIFEDSVDFARAHFHGHTFFHRALFRGNSVRFESVRFDEETVFEGNQADVCVSRSELDPAIEKELRETNTVCENSDNEGFLNFEIPFVDATELQNHLQKNLALTEPERTAIIRLWNAYSTPMFELKQGVNFKNLFLSNKADQPYVNFNNVDLVSTGFRGTDLSRIRFLNVTWPEREIFWHFTKRKVLYDEVLLPSLWSELKIEMSFRRRHSGLQDTRTLQKKYAAIAVLYQQLKKGYAADGLTEEARDFYFGEIEMARHAMGFPRRWLSLSFAYRILSGYGRQEGVAFGWLIFFLAILFPLMYGFLNPTLYDHWWAWPLSHSLRVATFLRDVETTSKVGVPASVSRLTNFLEGIERIVVTVQASLVVIALKWRFDPGRFESYR